MQFLIYICAVCECKMIMRTVLEKLSHLFFIALLWSSCSDAVSIDKARYASELDSLFISWRSELYSAPSKIKEEVKDKLNGTMNDSIWYYKLLAFYSVCLFQENNLDSAYLVNQLAISSCDKANNMVLEIQEIKAKALNDRGVFFVIDDRADSAISCLKQSAELFNMISEKSYLPEIYINLADCYKRISEFPLATYYYREALLVADSIGYLNKHEFSIYNGLATIYTELMNYPQADFYYSKLEEKLNEVSVNEQYFYANSRGNYYYNTKEYNEALVWFYKANQISDDFHNPFMKATVEFNLGEVYLLSEQLDSAQYYLDKGRETLKVSIPSVDYYVDGLYASLNLKKGKLMEAEKILSKVHNVDYVMPVYTYYNNKRLEELYVKRGDYRTAYQFRNLADKYNDSLRNVTLQNNIAEMEFRHKQDTMILNRDYRIISQERNVSRLQNQNNLAILCFLVVCLSLLFAILYYRRKRSEEKAKRDNEIFRLQMKNMKNRISPHYINNIVTAVLPSLKQDIGVHTMDLLTKSLRTELLVSEDIVITLKKEIETVDYYSHLRKRLFPMIPCVEWKISPEVNLQIPIISMVIQIPVENAMKYAFPTSQEDDFIQVIITKDKIGVHISVVDNGVGFDAIKSMKDNEGTGMGLRILKQTMEILNLRNTEKIKFEIKNFRKDTLRPGTQIDILIPHTYKFD